MRQIRSMGVAVVVGLSGSAALGQPSDEALFVTNQQSGTVSSMRVNFDGSLSLVNTYATGSAPQDVAITPDGRHLLVVNSDIGTTGPEQLSVFEIAANSTLVAKSAGNLVGDNPMGMGMTPQGYALISSTFSQDVRSFRLENHLPVGVGQAPAGLFPTRPVSSVDGRFAYCTSSVSPDDITAYSVAPGGALTRLQGIDIGLNAAFGAAVDPSGSSLYVSTGQGNTIERYSINQSTGVLTHAQTLAVGGSSAVELAVSPDGRWLFSAHVLSDSVRTTRINASGSLTALNQSVTIGSDVRDIVTNGRLVFVTDESPLGSAWGVHVLRVDSASGGLTPVGPATQTGGVRPQFMALWSPPVCMGDADGDRQVNFADINAVLRSFEAGVGPLGDADFDGDVDFTDISAVLNAWSSSCS
ncbi:MAG: beta-propeller fold lactonase family protein [Planctomycetota bacterium]|nr:beta-propeller fold lactonase family protein [Planctomycetota bacterium]